ncbi:hypothetical protein P9852_06360, partial [Geobacillus stearothermophilus]|nr:hypothetical protein [Geobacillus stearothermophilus]
KRQTGYTRCLKSGTSAFLLPFLAIFSIPSRIRSVYRTHQVVGIFTEKGMEKGIEKGMEKAKLDVAKRMLAKGFDADTIHELTGLPLETIEQLKP